MRLVFAGTPELAVPSLVTLLADRTHDVVAVLTRPTGRAGRGRTPTLSPVAERARADGIEVLTPARPSEPEFLDRLRGLAPDCCAVVAYGGLVPLNALAVPRYGWVNLHFSLLPAWRGAAPVQHALLAGDEITGATTFRLEEGLDTGPVYGMLTESVRPDDTAGSLLDRLAVAGAALLAETLRAIAAGVATAQPQPSDGVSVAPKLGPPDARVDWSAPALRVDRLIRATTPTPGAWTTYGGGRLRLGPVRRLLEGGSLRPGELRRAADGSVLAGTGTRPVVLGEVRPEGRRTIAAADWANGIRLGSDPDATGQLV